MTSHCKGAIALSFLLMFASCKTPGGAGVSGLMISEDVLSSPHFGMLTEFGSQRVHQSRIKLVAVAQDADVVATASRRPDQAIVLWNRDGMLIRNLSEDLDFFSGDEELFDMKISADGEWLALILKQPSGDQGRVIVANLVSGGVQGRPFIQQLRISKGDKLKVDVNAQSIALLSPPQQKKASLSHPWLAVSTANDSKIRLYRPGGQLQNIEPIATFDAQQPEHLGFTDLDFIYMSSNQQLLQTMPPGTHKSLEDLSLPRWILAASISDRVEFFDLKLNGEPHQIGCFAYLGFTRSLGTDHAVEAQLNRCIPYDRHSQYGGYFSDLRDKITSIKWNEAAARHRSNFAASDFIIGTDKGQVLIVEGLAPWAAQLEDFWGSNTSIDSKSRGTRHHPISWVKGGNPSILAVKRTYIFDPLVRLTPSDMQKEVITKIFGSGRCSVDRYSRREYLVKSQQRAIRNIAISAAYGRSGQQFLAVTSDYGKISILDIGDSTNRAEIWDNKANHGPAFFQIASDRSLGRLEYQGGLVGTVQHLDYGIEAFQGRVDFIPEGSLLVSDQQGVLMQWQQQRLGSPVLIGTHSAQGSSAIPIVATAAAFDGKHLASMDQNGDIIVWNLMGRPGGRRGREAAYLPASKALVPQIYFLSDDRILFVSDDVYLWDWKSQDQAESLGIAQALVAPDERISSFSISEAGDILFLGSSRGSVTAIQLESKQMIGRVTQNADPSPVVSIAPFPPQAKHADLNGPCPECFAFMTQGGGRFFVRKESNLNTGESLSYRLTPVVSNDRGSPSVQNQSLSNSGDSLHYHPSGAMIIHPSSLDNQTGVVRFLWDTSALGAMPDFIEPLVAKQSGRISALGIQDGRRLAVARSHPTSVSIIDGVTCQLVMASQPRALTHSINALSLFKPQANPSAGNERLHDHFIVTGDQGGQVALWYLHDELLIP